MKVAPRAFSVKLLLSARRSYLVTLYYTSKWRCSLGHSAYFILLPFTQVSLHTTILATF